jgi:CCR4-NOT transcriptional regulation complex NOT5 subunit
MQRLISGFSILRKQTKKFDKDLKYIKTWLSENDINAEPIVEHTFARKKELWKCTEKR